MLGALFMLCALAATSRGRCAVVSIVETVRLLRLTSGHRYRELECHDPNLSILHCTRCRNQSVSWKYNNPGIEP